MAAACFHSRFARLVGLLHASGPVMRTATHRVLQQRSTPCRLPKRGLISLKSEAASLDSIATPLITAINDRNFWPEILEDLNARLPEEQTSGSPNLPPLPVENCWTGDKRTGKRAADSWRVRHLQPARSKAKTAASAGGPVDRRHSWCAVFICLIRNSRKSSSITFATWRARHFLLSIQKSGARDQIQLGAERHGVGVSLTSFSLDRCASR